MKRTNSRNRCSSLNPSLRHQSGGHHLFAFHLLLCHHLSLKLTISTTNMPTLKISGPTTNRVPNYHFPTQTHSTTTPLCILTTLLFQIPTAPPPMFVPCSIQDQQSVGDPTNMMRKSQNPLRGLHRPRRIPLLHPLPLLLLKFVSRTRAVNKNTTISIPSNSKLSL